MASLFAYENGRDLELISDREFYEKFEGIYFDFLSFDSKTKNEMFMLYKLFFETSFYEVKSSGINNFYKIDTKYRRDEKEKIKKREYSLDEMIKIMTNAIDKVNEVLGVSVQNEIAFGYAQDMLDVFASGRLF